MYFFIHLNSLQFVFLILCESEIYQYNTKNRRKKKILRQMKLLVWTQKKTSLQMKLYQIPKKKKRWTRKLYQTTAETLVIDLIFLNMWWWSESFKSLSIYTRSNFHKSNQILISKCHAVESQKVSKCISFAYLLENLTEMKPCMCSTNWSSLPRTPL
jgi:hypothetical protein